MTTQEERTSYRSPLGVRYAGRHMRELFSEHTKFVTWRKLWVALAEAQHELGLDISSEQIAEMRANVENIDYEYAEAEEKRIRHDVMAHVHTFARQCPAAAPIIHLGATSCYVCDNTDLILMREALVHIETKILEVIRRLADFAERYQDLVTLGFTHFQPAQPVTVGKRACLWIEDLLSDLRDLRYVRNSMRLRGCKGTTGTQASFLQLFNGNSSKCIALDQMVAEKMGFEYVMPVTGQTYSRKEDNRILNVLAGLAQSGHKFTNDIRLLQNMREISEPFGSTQVGSSAMPYKQNPMRSERLASLARFLINTVNNTAATASAQWLERTLDDSANRRLVIPEAFLAADAILNIWQDIAGGLRVSETMIAANLSVHLPFMASEAVMMEGVRRGGNRQELHELIRQHSLAAAEELNHGRPNDLLERIASDPAFRMSREEIEELMRPEDYAGRAAEQVREYLSNEVMPILNSADPPSESDGVDFDADSQLRV